MDFVCAYCPLGQAVFCWLIEGRTRFEKVQVSAVIMMSRWCSLSMSTVHVLNMTRVYMGTQVLCNGDDRILRAGIEAASVRRRRVCRLWATYLPRDENNWRSHSITHSVRCRQWCIEDNGKSTTVVLCRALSNNQSGRGGKRYRTSSGLTCCSLRTTSSISSSCLR